MYNKFKVLFASALLAVFSVQVSADATTAIKESLSKILSDYEISSVHETPVPGLYEVLLDSELVYVSADGRYLMQGRMIDLESREDLTEGSPRLAEARRRQEQVRSEAVKKIGDDNMIVFAPEKYDHTVTVFTDIDCGYCRKLHRQIDSYLDEGIRVRYLFYPRAGAGSPSFKKAVSVWCADDRKVAMTQAKAGDTVEEKECDNPVSEHVQLGRDFGISGTPAIVLDSGELVSGYVPAKRLLTVLEASGS